MELDSKLGLVMRLFALIAGIVFSGWCWAQCSVTVGEIEQLRELNPANCMARPDCLRGQLEILEADLIEPGGQVLRYRLHQDIALEKARLTNDLASSSARLRDWYNHRDDLDSDTRQYLIVRLDHDVDGLEKATKHFPWAWLDLMRRKRPQEDFIPVDTDRAEAMLGKFFTACPDAGEALLLESSRLAFRLGWPVWREVRQNLLAQASPPWETLREGWLLSAEQQAAAKHGEDAIEQLLAELEPLEASHGDQAGLWAYQSNIHRLDQDLSKAQEAVDRALAIDPCYPLQPHEYRPELADDLAGVEQLQATLAETILNCPPLYDTWSWWLFRAAQQPATADQQAIDHIRNNYRTDLFGERTPMVSRNLAQLDIQLDHQPEQAWARLAELFEHDLAQMESTLDETLATTLRLDLVSRAQGHAWLGLTGHDPEQGLAWFRRSERLLAEWFGDDDVTGSSDPELEFMESRRSELRWLQARADRRYADAVQHALDARQQGVPWIDMDEVRKVWLAAGGTLEELEAKLDDRSLALPAQWRGWRRIDKTLPDFELSDFGGQRWRRNDLAGKRVLVNLWATWCGPCLLELPKVQELHEHYVDDPTVQVLTINLDRDNPVARRLVEREGWTFPVLTAGLQSEAFADLAIPRNWIVDREIVRQWEQTGFNIEIAEHWVDDIVSLIEQMDSSGGD